MDVTLKNLIALLLLLFVVSEAAAYSGQEFSGAIPVFQEGESSSLIAWGNIAPRLRSSIKVSVLFSRWKISAKLLPDSDSEINSFSSLGWIRQTLFSVTAVNQDLYRRNGVLRI